MIDFQDVGAELAERLAITQQPGRSGMVRRNETMRFVAFEFAHHDRRENARIDIAAAQDQPTFCRLKRSAPPASPRVPPRPRLPPLSSASVR